MYSLSFIMKGEIMHHKYLLLKLLNNTKEDVERIKDIFKLLYTNCYKEFRIIYIPNISITIDNYSNEDLENICNMDSSKQGKITIGVEFFNKLVQDSTGVTMDTYISHPINLINNEIEVEYGEPMTGIMSIDEISNVTSRKYESETVDYLINSFLLSVIKLQSYYHMILEQNNMREKIIEDNYIIFDVLDSIANMTPFYIAGNKFDPVTKYSSAFTMQIEETLYIQGLQVQSISKKIIYDDIYYYKDIHDIKKYFIKFINNKDYDGVELYLFPDPTQDILKEDIDDIDRMIIYCKKIIAPYSGHEIYIMNSIYSTFSKAPKCFTNLFEFNSHFDNLLVDILSAGWYYQIDKCSKEEYLDDRVRFRLAASKKGVIDK